MLQLQQRLLSPLTPQRLQPGRPKRPYEERAATIGHRILNEDRRAEDIPDAIFDRLDLVISRVKAEVTVGTVTTVEEARDVLRRVEDVVTAQNFVCSIPYFLVTTFAVGLTTRGLDGRLTSAPENALRRSHLLAHPDEQFSHVDCDLSSLLYLCIGEALNLPLCMVEVPEHNFVRWRLSPTVHLNWDTNFGFDKYTDVGYATRYGVSADQIVNGVYLADMTSENVDGYFAFLRGLTFQGAGLIPDAISEYRSAVLRYGKSPSARNNIAWQYVSSRDAQAIVTPDEALGMATVACNLVRSDSYLDTLACVYAQNGDREVGPAADHRPWDRVQLEPRHGGHGRAPQLDQPGVRSVEGLRASDGAVDRVGEAEGEDDSLLQLLHEGRDRGAGQTARGTEAEARTSRRGRPEGEEHRLGSGSEDRVHRDRPGRVPVAGGMGEGERSGQRLASPRQAIRFDQLVQLAGAFGNLDFSAVYRRTSSRRRSVMKIIVSMAFSRISSVTLSSVQPMDI